MPRMLDLKCGCGEEVFDYFVMSVPDKIVHFDCGQEMQIVFLPPKKRDATWSDKDAVVVFRDKQGKIRYPGKNDAPTPKDCERVTMKSLREVESFERANGVRSEMAWFDKGSGRGFDDQPAARKQPSEQERFKRFLEHW